MSARRVVLAYSGGLDTSAAIAWLAERDWEVVAVAVDVGQPGDLSEAVERARRTGAVEAHLVDARQKFVDRFVLPAIAMNALYGARYPLISALSRPLIAEALADVAAECGATAVAHGCTGKGNDQFRFEASLAVLAPELEVLAPVRDWGMNRHETIRYAGARGVAVTATEDSPYSIDENLWGRSIECGELEDPWTAAPEEVFALTSHPSDAPASPRDVELSFVQGVPRAVDGEAMEPVHVIESLQKIAGGYGFGRLDLIEDRLVGIKSREVYEAPAALVLIKAHADLETMTLERAVLREKRRLESVWADLVYEGLWFSPLREAIDAFCASTQPSVTGDVRVRFTPAGCHVVGRRSALSLYRRDLATYEHGDAFDHVDAAGFVRLWSLPSRTWARARATRG